MDNFYKLWTISLLSISISALCAFLVSIYGYSLSLVDTPKNRSSHTRPTPRGGGIGILIVCIVIGTVVTSDYLFASTSGAIGLMGLVDDRFSISQKLRLIMQFIITFVAIYSNEFSNIALVLFWMIFITSTANFYNFMDGINGIAALSGLIAFGFMAFFSYCILKDINIFLISTCMVFACLGFLPFNFPNARVFMGDVGSLILGFIFSVFVFKLSYNISIFICLIMFLSVFYADTILTFYYRWQRKENLFKAHRCHLYQYLSNEIGLAHWKVSIIYASVQLVFGLAALLSYISCIKWQVVTLLVFSLLFVSCYKYIFILKSKNAKILL
ncbi:MAG: glycosyltransferase family 4 protein [Nitrospirae bacterium]|nr:glycosyltransferase family 4 protein [Nitrospirota bacterium]MBF0554111.1 glycosyltransferase family 4 protein [Nitrospirota bacterium]